MRSAIWLGALLIILLLNVVASIRVVRWNLFTAAQKTAWVVFVWIIPLLGAALALQITSESSRGPPTGQSSGAGIGDGAGIALGTSGMGTLGDGGHCGAGGHSGDGGNCGDGGGGSGH